MKIVNKKILCGAIIFVIAFAFVACKNKVPTNESGTPPKTGKEIDITHENKKVVFARGGDVLHLSLQSGNPKFQWSLKQPITGVLLSLDKHDVARNEETQISVSEWKFKVEKAASFELVFHYESPGVTQEPKEVFQALIISDDKKSDAKNIYMTRPQPEDVFDDSFTLSGYARVFEATVNYHLTKSDGNSVVKGFVQASDGAPEYGYFEDVVEFEKPQKTQGLLKIFQISAKDGSEVDVVNIPVKFSEKEK